ncbi:RBBP9/YdeN family alpha/beta hydrolase [Sphingomonas sp. MMS24-J13]|uniref:RBBP9/YdeN family alpha/beta hydrolase n=1 Tax=Sphingomonas sp. MMS24-J13 TaxID=3238686 RepID=UPI00384B7FA8
MTDGELSLSPLCLIVPGLGNSGSGHWQTIWEQQRHDCLRVQLGMWDDPVRNVWISRIDQAVRAAQGPVVVVAHSLGCHAVLWWTRLLGDSVPGNVVGAMLVAPPDVDRDDALPVIRRFAPAPQAILPFPAIVVASTDDPYCEADRTEELAARWGAEFVLLEGEGHINAASGLADWRDGQDLLEGLLDARPRPSTQTKAGGRPGAPRGGEVRRIWG